LLFDWKANGEDKRLVVVPPPLISAAAFPAVCRDTVEEQMLVSAAIVAQKIQL